MKNSTFRGADPIEFNACVGNNGVVDYLTYAKGFSKAANLILDQVLNTDGDDIDSFIYPICFNMRHSIELRLKGAIEEIDTLAKIQKLKLDGFDLAGSHDIGNIWQYFQTNSESLDNRYKIINDALKTTILDIAEIDSTGQTFRYPFDTENKKHLTEQRIISCLVLKNSFSELEKNLDNLHSLNEMLIEEYKVGTYVGKLSRSQIFNLVAEIPLREKWHTDLDKTAIKAQYNLASNKELINILEISQNNYEISSKIGVKKDLIALPDDLILEICSAWVSFFHTDLDSLNTQGSLLINESDLFKPPKFGEILEYFEQKKLVNNTFQQKINLDLVADLWSLFYLSRDHYNYSESYLWLYESYLVEIKNESSLLDAFDHVFFKTNFLRKIIRSLFFLQQIELAEKIVSALSLEKMFPEFISKARNRTLFQKWEYLDYQVY